MSDFRGKFASNGTGVRLEDGDISKRSRCSSGCIEAGAGEIRRRWGYGMIWAGSFRR